MPGYGFSDKPTQRGFGPEQIAEGGAALMERLGYDRYGIQGGDWGSIVSRWHAFNYPARALGLHLNMLVGGRPPEGEDPSSPEEIERSRSRSSFYLGAVGVPNTAENAYAQIQGTKPQTVGYALHDSPSGQAAWIARMTGTVWHVSPIAESLMMKRLLIGRSSVAYKTIACCESDRNDTPRPQVSIR